VDCFKVPETGLTLMNMRTGMEMIYGDDALGHVMRFVCKQESQWGFCIPGGFSVQANAEEVEDLLDAVRAQHAL
jgi:hypothetical protein